MPFKGDMRLGGPHDNEASLNGTSSDFDSVLAAGTFIETIYQTTYPVANGGGYVINASFPNQNCDVDKVADGLGGNYIDWSTARNLTYVFGTFTDSGNINNSITLPAGNNLNLNSYPYSGGTYESYYEHDGQGGYNGLGGNSSYASQGGLIVVVSYTPVATYTAVPSGGTQYQNGSRGSTSYYHDGSGSHSTEHNYSYYSEGHVYFSFNEPIYTYVTQTGNSYGNGTYSIQQMIADGYGGYSGPVASGSTGGSYYSYGTVIYQRIDNLSGSAVEVDGSWHYPYAEGENITWDGSGGYNYSNWWAFPYGTYFASAYGYNYFWDGTGGYYTEGS